MVSYRQLDQHGIKQVVLHERETSSSGRPKAQSLQQEDQFFNYEFDSRGGLIKKEPKTPLSQYTYWHKHNVEFAPVGKDGRYGNQRITPLSEFESRLGVKTSIPSYYYKWCVGYGTGKGESWGCQKKTFTHEEWQIFKQTHTIDYGQLEIIHKLDVGTGDWYNYFSAKASEQNLEVIGNINGLNFQEKQKPAVIEKIPETSRPNPREVEKVEPIEIEPIKEVVKYSPLMIAGVIAVVVILLLKRRRA